MNIEEIGKKLQDLTAGIDAALAEVDKLEEKIVELEEHKQETFELEKNAIAEIEKEWAEARTKYAEQISALYGKKESLKASVKSQEASLSIATECFKLAQSRLDTEEVKSVIEDLETAQTPDFKSARDKLFPEDANDTETEEKVAVTG